MATGHYVRRLPEQGKSKEYKLLRSTCEEKDQSYFLYRTTQDELSHTLFPIGYYTKEEVRFMAKELGFHNYDKKGTKGICFIGKINLKDFLQQKIPPKKGNFVTPKGKIVGEHDGIMYYTIGQRIGPRFGMNIKKQPGKESGQRWYVAVKDIKKNEIIVAPEGHKILLRKEIAVLKNNFHFINKKTPPKKVLARIRHVGELLPSKIRYNKEKKIYLITLNQAITGVAQGQSVVLYNKDEVIGGGEIVFPEMIK
jgi:tRNA-specific 2-thiouridylase